MEIDEKVIISLLLDYYGELLSESQLKMMKYKFNDDLSLAEISESEGITRQGVRDVIQRGTKLLYEYEDKLKLRQKNDKLCEELLYISDMAEKKGYAGIKPEIDRIIEGLEEN